ncbi:MAG: DUF6992 family protein [Bacteroidota bacterium]
MKKISVLFFLVLAFAGMATAQQEAVSLQDYHQTRLSIQKNGMLTLAGWAAGNMIISGWAMQSAQGSNYRFHQMNVFWNVVNIGIAAGGYFGLPESSEIPPLTQTVTEYQDFNKILLLNAGLDVAYIMTGLYMKERAKNVEKRKAMLKGYGNSIMLQGGFLFLFDVALYFINQGELNGILSSEQWQLMASPAGLGLTISL